MPSRIVREGILTSEAVDRLTYEAEVFYRRLISVADDFGLFTAHASLVRAACYPLRLDRVENVDVNRWLRECSDAGLLRLYVVEGKPYLEILRFGQRERARKPKFPLPPAAGDPASEIKLQPEVTPTPDTRPTDDGQVTGTRPASAASIRIEYSNRVVGAEHGHAARDRRVVEPKGFGTFWAAYPRRLAKQNAVKAWMKLTDSERAAAIEGVKVYPFDHREDGRFIPHAATWLNGKRWQDEPTLPLAPPVPRRTLKEISDLAEAEQKR